MIWKGRPIFRENRKFFLQAVVTSGILKNKVTVQYLHSYEQKSNENRLRRWDFCVQPSGFWHIHAKTPRGIVASE